MTGLSVDFVVFSVIGFVCYAAFCVCLYWVPSIQQQYREAHHGEDSLVEINDVIFTVHASFITSVYLIQVLMYRKPEERLSRIGWAMTGVFLLLAGILIVLSAAKVTTWLFLLTTLTWVKLILTVIKYIPQAWSNYKRKSTVGWSIINVLLDFSGGVFSIAQIIIDSVLTGSWDGIKGFMIKLTLGLVTLIFDTIFILQHYYWFPQAKGPHVTQIEEADGAKMVSPTDSIARYKRELFEQQMYPGEELEKGEMREAADDTMKVVGKNSPQTEHHGGIVSPRLKSPPPA